MTGSVGVGSDPQMIWGCSSTERISCQSFGNKFVVIVAYLRPRVLVQDSALGVLGKEPQMKKGNIQVVCGRSTYTVP